LYEIQVNNPPPFSTSSTLTSLRLIECTIDKSTFAVLVSPVATPHMVALEISACCAETDGRHFIPALPSDLLPRLERLVFTAGDFWSSRTFRPPSDKILFQFHCGLGGPEILDIRHLSPVHIALRVYDPHSWQDTDQSSTISALQQPLPLLKAPTSLKSISSSHLFRRPVSVPGALADAYGILLRAASEHGVEMRWFEGDVFDAFDDFGRYLKQKKKERDANDSAGGRD
jgi:hypothetical protein